MTWTSSDEMIARTINSKDGIINVIVGSFTRDHPTQCINGILRKTYWLWRLEFVSGSNYKMFPDHRPCTTKHNATEDALDFLENFIDVD